MSEIELCFSDLQRAVEGNDTRLPELLVRYLEQDDPDPGVPEVMSPEQLDERIAARQQAADHADADDDDDDDLDEEDGLFTDWPSPPSDAYTASSLSRAVAAYTLRQRTPAERKAARLAAFAAAEASPYTPPRLRLGDLLIDLYHRGDELGRAALIAVFTRGNLRWGSWKAAKRIYKLAEASHDLEMFGALAYRFDARGQVGDVSPGTFIYLRRRAWRYLRQLGRALPEAYAVAAAEVLRHYPAGHRQSTWVAGHIFAHKNLRYVVSPVSFSAPSKADVCAYPDCWKLSPAPLLRLLELAEHPAVCTFAIVQLRAHHALALRAMEVGWLERLGRRRIDVVQAFIVELLRDNPELHQSKLRELGLHEMVLGLLRSGADPARTYALEYARTYATDVPASEWISLVEGGASAVVQLAVAKLEELSGADITLPGLVRLLRNQHAYGMAVRKLRESFGARDLDAELFLRIASGEKRLQELVIELYNTANLTIPVGHWKLAVERNMIVRWAMQELGKRRAEDLGVDWIRAKLEVPELTDTVGRWLTAGMLSGPNLDVAWVRSLVERPRLRPLALGLLGNRALITPARVGLTWLLEQARSSDEELAQFAQRFLLGNFAPQDFAEGSAESGQERLWQLLSGEQPEPVRLFAASYLKAHHPTLGPELAEVKSLGLTPRLTHDDYPLARLRALAADDRADVRRFAVSIIREELLRWGDESLPYALAASAHREARALGSELLLGLGGDGANAAPASWLDGRRLFALADSEHKGTRETALTLIRRSYERVGGAERLGWLMESPEREVRLFAVRLFWDRHRPRAVPADWKPGKDVGVVAEAAPFQDLPALRQFVRDVLFGLPPGRQEKRDDKPAEPGAGKAARALPERPLPASVAKARLIETLRELALAERDFAAAISPVLGEFIHSQAKGERHAALAALAAIRANHPELGELGLPKPIFRAPKPARAGAGGHRG
ncbi:MAG: hypothetical protein R3B48_10665 [Kofleriaceae bacterium]